MNYVLITGASSGLGTTLALHLAKKNFSLLLHYHKNPSAAEEIAHLCRQEGVEVKTLQGDFSTSSTLQDFIAQCQKEQIYALINNVGPYLVAPLSQTSDTQWLQLFQTNLHAPFSLSRSLQVQRIINIGAPGLQARRANSYCGAYRIAKSALLEMTLSFAKEFIAKTTVNMVSPGILENSIDKEHWNPAEPIELEEIARVVAFLLEKESHHITGQNIEVAHGFGL